VAYPDGKVAALCTDLGEVTETVWQNIIGADLVMLESNYDADMLKSGRYPPELKQRIASDHGHLSNSDCGTYLAKLADEGTAHFILGHLSEENNTPQAAEYSAVNGLLPRVRQQDYMLYVAPPSGGKAVVF
jgi:phosphoribosyl 1,2-cyclic phosphodiesterase